jgi:Domain of unknown function (DUF4386)
MQPGAIKIQEPSAWARVAGICWLIAIIGGVFAERFVRFGLITDDPTTTIQNIISNEALYRLGSVAHFAATASYLALTAIMYILLAPVNRAISLIAAYFSVVGCAIWMLVLVTDAAPLVFFGSAGATTSVGDHIETVVYAMLRLHSKALMLGMLCFGMQLLLLGVLVLRAVFMPRWIGAIMALGGVGYLVAGFLAMLAPALADQFGRYAFMPGQISEVLLGLWLTILGVNTAKWRSQIRAPD